MPTGTRKNVMNIDEYENCFENQTTVEGKGNTNQLQQGFPNIIAT